MEFSPTAIALIVSGIIFSVVIISVAVWILPLFIQKQRSYKKRRDIQKKVNEELVKNTRYKSASVSTSAQSQKAADYGSTHQRDLEKNENEEVFTDYDGEKNEVPFINVTCEDEILTTSETERDDKSDAIDPVRNNKRRFSSIVFSHSDELKVLSDDSSLDVEKRERRASMSLFDTCKLACPDLSQNLAQSTEHLNELVLSDGNIKGKLYFTLSQNESNKNILELVIIKVSDIVDKKQKNYQMQLELVMANNSPIQTTQTTVRTCGGEVVNFDESFTFVIENEILSDDSNDLLQLIFTLIQHETKKSSKSQKVAEIRFDLLGLIEGQILNVNGQEQFVICRNFVDLTEKERFKENGGKVLIFLRFVKTTPLNVAIGFIEVKDVTSSKPFNGINIRVTLASAKKILESRKSKIFKKKNQNDEGVYKIDESYEFNLSLQKYSSKSSLISNSENLFITVFLCGRNNLGFSHVLGKCVLGPIQFADGPGLLHWSKGMSNIGEIVYQWHVLKN